LVRFWPYCVIRRAEVRRPPTSILIWSWIDPMINRQLRNARRKSCINWCWCYHLNYCFTYRAQIISSLDIMSWSILQWPDDYDFALTRAINSRGAAVASRNIKDELEEPEYEKKVPDASVVSVTNEAQIDPELEPVSLNKAFKFAARASIVLVRASMFPCNCIATNAICSTDFNTDDTYPSPPLFCPDGL